MAGALTGASMAGIMSERTLYLLFGLLLGYVAWNMLFRSPAPAPELSKKDFERAHRLGLMGTYRERGQHIDFVVRNIPLGLAASTGAGVLSGLLGIGGGVVKVPVMNLVMGVPFKVASATSNLTIGVTAAASALVYFSRGDINPYVAVPVALGVLVGARMGSQVLPKVRSEKVIRVFVLVLLWMAFQMSWKWWSLRHGS